MKSSIGKSQSSSVSSYKFSLHPPFKKSYDIVLLFFISWVVAYTAVWFGGRVVVVVVVEVVEVVVLVDVVFSGFKVVDVDEVVVIVRISFSIASCPPSLSPKKIKYEKADIDTNTVSRITNLRLLFMI